MDAGVTSLTLVFVFLLPLPISRANLPCQSLSPQSASHGICAPRFRIAEDRQVTHSLKLVGHRDMNVNTRSELDRF